MEIKNKLVDVQSLAAVYLRGVNKLKTFRQNFVSYSENQPTHEDNVVWVSPTGTTISVPTVEDINTLESKLNIKIDSATKKTRIDYDNTSKAFMIGNKKLNYKELHDVHLVNPDFAFIVYGDRAYLLSYVQDDASAMREMRFQSVIAVQDGNNLLNVKTSGIYVKSNDGINIASVNVSDINSENNSYKASYISDDNKTSNVWYPTTKATVDYVDTMLTPLSNKINTVEDTLFSAQRIIEQHYASSPDYGTYTIKFPKWETSHSSDGEKIDDAQGLSVTPATDTVKEINNFPHCFDTLDVNAYVDNDGVRHITAIKGDNAFKDEGNVDVFVCCRTYWERTWEDDNYEYYSRCYYPRHGYTIKNLAINKDGTYNSWFLIAKYMAGNTIDDNGALTHVLHSAKNLRAAHYMSGVSGNELISDSISWSGMQSIFKQNGTYYTGSLSAELAHIECTSWLYFGTKNIQKVMYGYNNSSFQYSCAEPMDSQNYFVVTASQANNIDIYQCVSIGDNGLATSPDRNAGVCHNIAYDVRVVNKITLDSGNVAIVVDHTPFTTTSTSWISSFHEISGYSDFILGRNGSPVSNTNGRHGAVIDGIEFMTGGYECLSNVIFNATDNPLERQLVITNDANALSTNVNTYISNATVVPYLSTVTTNGTWNYVTHAKIDMENGIIVNTQSGLPESGSAYGYADAQYFDATTSSQREVLSLGSLGYGGITGFRFVDGSDGVAIANWNILARLSLNAVRG